MSSTIQQDFVDSLELRSVDRGRHCGVDLRPPAMALIDGSELFYYLHNRFRLSVRVKNPVSSAGDAGADQPFSNMNAPCVSNAGTAIYSWENGPDAPCQVVKPPVADGMRGENA